MAVPRSGGGPAGRGGASLTGQRRRQTRNVTNHAAAAMRPDGSQRRSVRHCVPPIARKAQPAPTRNRQDSPPWPSNTRRHPHYACSGAAIRGTLKPRFPLRWRGRNEDGGQLALHLFRQVFRHRPELLTDTSGGAAESGWKFHSKAPRRYAAPFPAGAAPKNHRDTATRLPPARGRPLGGMLPRRTRLKPGGCERTSNGAATPSARAAGRKDARPGARDHRAARATPASSSAVICHNNRIDRDSIYPRREFRSAAGEASLRKCSRDRGHPGPREARSPSFRAARHREK
ncbi:hypothetical protein Ga0074812_12190 [Parafrankia irregularis]|uniref:Uncharacterized protein n=1 Tax=Parafrankia irregularis TaxID=795642 RepID=A0A0S4QU26_9ACTN|nr:hypothetical protein Ga0074812_12190 [Parafrankia irregularis]